MSDINIGPSAVLSVLIGQAARSISEETSSNYIAVAIFMAFLAGIIQTAMGFLKLGVLIDFVPFAVMLGFTTGAAVT